MFHKPNRMASTQRKLEGKPIKASAGVLVSQVITSRQSHGLDSTCMRHLQAHLGIKCLSSQAVTTLAKASSCQMQQCHAVLQANPSEIQLVHKSLMITARCVAQTQLHEALQSSFNNHDLKWPSSECIGKGTFMPFAGSNGNSKFQWPDKHESQVTPIKPGSKHFCWP